MEMKVVMMCVYHTLEYMPLEEDPMFYLYSFQAKWNKIISLAVNMFSWTKSSFIFTTAGEGTLASCKKSNIFCEIDKGTVRLFDSCLQLAEETFCKILSGCQGECDMESDEIGENHKIPSNSKEEGDLTGLTAIWSKRRPVRPPRHMEDFL